MPNNWDGLIEGLNQGLGAVAEGYNQMRNRELADEIYNTAMLGIKQTLSDYQAQQSQQEQDDLKSLQSIGQPPPEQTYNEIDHLKIDSTPADVNGNSRINVQKKPITMADLYSDITDAQVRLAQLGDAGRLKGEQLAGYLEQAMKNPRSKMVKIGTDYYSYEPNNVMGTLQRIYAPDELKPGKINIVWGQPEYVADEDGTYWREYPIEDMATGELLDRKHRVQVTADEWNKYQRSLKETTRSRGSDRGSIGKINLSYEKDAMLGDTKKLDAIVRQIDAKGGLDKLEDMADQKDPEAIKLLNAYDEQTGILASYGVDPLSTVEAFRGANSQSQFDESLQDRQAYIADIQADIARMLTPANWMVYVSSNSATDPRYENVFDQEFWQYVFELQQDGVPMDIIDRYVKRPYDHWRKNEGFAKPIKP